MPVALDEYPIHQTPLSMRYVDSSDRNFYDRCYFNAHDRTGDIFLITGAGIYPQLGVKDAYAVVRRGDLQHVDPDVRRPRRRATEPARSGRTGSRWSSRCSGSGWSAMRTPPASAST